MDDYGDSYEPLIAKMISPSEIEVIDDFKYNLLKEGNFATDYTQLKQKDFVQLPRSLVKPRKASKMKFTFTSANTGEEDDEETQPELSEKSPPESQLETKSQLEMESPLDSEYSSDSSLSKSSSSDDEMDMNTPATYLSKNEKLKAD